MGDQASIGQSSNRCRSGGSPLGIEMRTTRPFGECLVALVSGLTVAACLAGTAPIVGSPGSSAAPSLTTSIIVRSPSASPVAVASTTPTAATPSVAPSDPCGTGREDMIAGRVEMPDEIRIGGVGAEMTTHAIGLLNGSYHATDSVPGGIGLEPDERASRATPGGAVAVAAPPAQISGAQVFLGRWDQVTFEGGLGNPPEERTASAVRIESDGTASFVAPTLKGEYVATVHIDWQTTCLEGNSFGYARIVVR